LERQGTEWWRTQRFEDGGRFYNQKLGKKKNPPPLETLKKVWPCRSLVSARKTILSLKNCETINLCCLKPLGLGQFVASSQWKMIRSLFCNHHGIFHKHQSTAEITNVTQSNSWVSYNLASLHLNLSFDQAFDSGPSNLSC
jgi:hypothetical protein